jgi:hypothetical protein
MDKIKLLVLSNLALCCNSLGNYPDAVTFASKGLELDGANPKLLYR